jgi:hypothetical protein
VLCPIEKACLQSKLKKTTTFLLNFRKWCFFFYYYFVISIKQFVLHDLLFAHLSHALLPPAWQIGNWTLGWKHRAENGSTTIHLAKLLSHQVEGEEWQRGCIIYLVIHGTPLPLSVPVYIYIYIYIYREIERGVTERLYHLPCIKLLSHQATPSQGFGSMPRPRLGGSCVMTNK